MTSSAHPSPQTVRGRLSSNVPPSYADGGEEFPDRAFVGGLPEDTNEEDLRKFFERFVRVREAKIIRFEDESKRNFGFLTLWSEKDSTFLKGLPSEKLIMKGQKLNVGPAIKKKGARRYYSDTSSYACVTPDGYFPPGSYSFSLDKSPHFFPRTPSKQQSPPLSDVSASTPVTSERHHHADEKLAPHEPNNNLAHLTNPNLHPRVDPATYFAMYQQMLPYPAAFLNPAYLMSLQQNVVPDRPAGQGTNPNLMDNYNRAALLNYRNAAGDGPRPFPFPVDRAHFPAMYPNIPGMARPEVTNRPGVPRRDYGYGSPPADSSHLENIIRAQRLGEPRRDPYSTGPGGDRPLARSPVKQTLAHSPKPNVFSTAKSVPRSPASSKGSSYKKTKRQSCRRDLSPMHSPCSDRSTELLTQKMDQLLNSEQDDSDHDNVF